MKKTVLLLAGMFISVFLSAQVLFEETFSGTNFPPSGWMVFGNMQNWESSNTNLAGGEAPEMHIKGTPSFNGTQRIISPQINTTGQTKVIITLKHMFAHASGSNPITLGVDTRSSNGAWNNVWKVDAKADIPAQTQVIIVQNANVGSTSFQFSIYVNGSSSNMKDWYIDDIQVVAPLELDAAMSAINVPSLFTGNQAVKGAFSNLGSTPVTSIDVNWQLDDGDVHTTSLTGLNVALGNSHNFESSDSLIAVEGAYDLKVWISNVNGQAEDMNPENDLMVKPIIIPDVLIEYRPLFEEFTSSTCGPCASFNNSTLNPFIQQNGDKITLVKYQMNWPGSGDPYYTPEGGVRKTYYGVNAVPMLFVDGKNVATNTAAVNAAFNATYGTYAYVNILSTHEIQGNNVIIDAKIVPYANYPNVKIHIAIIERKTTQNARTNGETEFHNVMMKMVPDANGTSANLINGEPVVIKKTIDMSGTHVEEMNDLMVAIFIQENSSKTIHNSRYSVEIGATVTINIPDNAMNVPVNQTFTIDYSQAVRMAGGQAITNSNVAQLINFREDGINGAPVTFTATINAAKTQIVVKPEPNLKYDQRYFLKVDGVENMNGVAVNPIVRNFTTLLNVDVPVNELVNYRIYPNPANTTLFINDVKGVEHAEVISVVGNVVKSVSNFGSSRGETGIDISNLPAGMYFIRLTGKGLDTTKRFIIAR